MLMVSESKRARFRALLDIKIRNNLSTRSRGLRGVARWSTGPLCVEHAK
jgi:hypothetical protein